MLKDIRKLIILIFIILALSASVWSFVLKKVTVDERLLTEDSLFNETIVKKRVEEKLSHVKKEKERLQDNVNNLMRKAEALEKELVNYKGEIDSFKAQLSGVYNDNVIIEREIIQANSNIDSLRNRIGYITSDTLKASEKLTLLAKTRDALKKKLSQYAQKEPVKLVKRKVQNNIPEPIASIGEVLTVNREFAFLVISLGKRDGITEGMVFNIQRDNKNLGQIKVETVRENISAAALINKDTLSEIKAGDMVFSRHEM
jgi:prefoldin subunit 5